MSNNNHIANITAALDPLPHELPADRQPVSHATNPELFCVGVTAVHPLPGKGGGMFADVRLGAAAAVVSKAQAADLMDRLSDIFGLFHCPCRAAADAGRDDVRADG